MLIGSPSRTRAMTPPAAASGETWPIDSPEVPPENRPSVTSAHAAPSPRPLRKRGRIEHLLHARPAARSLVADHHDVAGLDPLAQDRLDRVLLGLDDHGRSRELAGSTGRRPAVFTTQPSTDRLPRNTASPPSVA